MNDWYSSYLFSRERQRELIRQAEQRRRLDEARGAAGSGRSGNRPARSPLDRRPGRLLTSLRQAQP
jgi:hypothetical protein